MERRGPFGFWAGMQGEEFEGDLAELQPFKFGTASAPKVHSAFDQYILQITPHTGLAWVKALGKEIHTSSFGYELLGEFKAMHRKLEAAYGASSIDDILFHDSIWNEPRDWMQGLLSRERLLSCTWERGAERTLRDSLKSVFLGVQAISTDTGFIYVEYAFENFDESNLEIASAEDDAL